MSIPNNIPTLLSQQDAVEASLKYIRARADGEIPLLTTCYENLNRLVGGGFYPNSMLLLGGKSGSGKSTLSKRIIYSIMKNCLKEGKKCVTLSFNFEMEAHKTVGREFAGKTKKTLTELYSNYEPIDDSTFEMLKAEAEYIKNFHIYYVEEPRTAEDISKTISYYWNYFCSKEKEKIFIVEIDHTMLTKANDGEGDKKKIDVLNEYLIQLKKKIATEGGNVFFIILSQLNRESSSPERMKPQLHRPTTADLFQTSTGEQAADYIIIPHNPSKLSIKEYTEEKKPVYVNLITDDGECEERPFIYLHLLKNRDGEADLTATMIGELKYFQYIPVYSDQFRKMHEDFNTKGTCEYRVKSL